MIKKVTIILLITLSVSNVLAENKVNNDQRELVKMLEIFSIAIDRIQKDNVEKVDSKKLIESAINGMLTSLDPYSSYFDKESYKEMLRYSKGGFGGLGILVTLDRGLVKIITPIDDTPAYKAGIKSGDYIISINDEPVMGMTLNDAVNKMKGKAGTKLKISTVREGVSEPIQHNLTRQMIEINPTKSKMIGNVGYVRVSKFSGKVSNKIIQEIKKLQKKNQLMSSLILDLRDNPGGLLNEAVAVSDIFLNKGEIVSIKGRSDENMKRFMAKKGGEFEKIPMVVLINSGTASAPEIVSGALQDHGRAIIMGQKSYGKGSVQTVMPMPNGAAIKFTTALYYRPSGEKVNSKGITPDIVVKDYELKSKKNSTKSLKNKEKKGGGKSKTIDKYMKHEGQKEDDSYKSDYQLSRAVDLLKSLSITKKYKY